MAAHIIFFQIFSDFIWNFFVLKWQIFGESGEKNSQTYKMNYNKASYCHYDFYEPQNPYPISQNHKIKGIICTANSKNSMAM